MKNPVYHVAESLERDARFYREQATENPNYSKEYIESAAVATYCEEKAASIYRILAELGVR